VVVFHRLDRGSLRKIIDRYVAEIEGLLAARRLELELDDGVYDRLIELGASEPYGARELRRIVDHHLRQPLAQEILRREEKGGTIRVTLGGQGLTFRSRGHSIPRS